MVLAAFTFNTSEFIPVGLLTDIAAGLGVTETDAGLPPLIIRAFLAFVRFFCVTLLPKVKTVI